MQSHPASWSGPYHPRRLLALPRKLGRERFIYGSTAVPYYQATRGRNPELRERVYQVLRSCQVEMIILDEAHRIFIEALSEIRDISDHLEIAVVLVGCASDY
jgi:DNA transposition AAA+ family ATPase